MTLCHQNKNYIEKWIEYLNREKFDCNMEYNAKNVGMGKQEDSSMYMGSDNSEEIKRKRSIELEI